jgi:hypothetical protein
MEAYGCDYCSVVVGLGRAVVVYAGEKVGGGLRRGMGLRDNKACCKRNVCRVVKRCEHAKIVNLKGCCV